MKSPYLAPGGKRFHLSRLDPADTGTQGTGAAAEKKTKEKMRKDLQKISELQNLLYAAGKHPVLIVIQGIDTAGKDGTIRHVFSGVNPQGCNVTCFKQPTPLELAHDYLWRIHQACPARGHIMIFNRSHYESVLVERVHGLVPKEVWKRRYDEINRFERLLTRSGTILIKLFLNLSKKEQKKRLLARESDPLKRWKSNPADWVERKSWNAYQEAFEEMLEKTSPTEAPWYVIPSDNKWYRNLVAAEIILETLKPYRDEWEKAILEKGIAAIAGKPAV